MVTSSYGSLSSLQASSVRSRTLPSRWISLSILPPRHSRLPTSLNRTPDLRPRTTPLLFEKSSRSNSTYPVVTCWWRSEWRLYVQWKNTNLTSCTSRRSNTISRNHRLYICSTLYAVYMYVYVQPLVQICELTQEQHLDCYVAFMLHSIQPCMPPEGKFSPSGVILEYYLNDLIHWSLGPKNCMQKMVSHHSSPCFVTALPHI